MTMWLPLETIVVYSKKCPMILLLIMTLQTSGCSVVGFGVGIGVDASRSESEFIKSDYREKIRKNKTVVVTLLENVQIEGISEGLVMVHDSVYLTYFNRNDSALVNSPYPGDRITVVTGFVDSVEGIFLGYDLEDNHHQVLSTAPVYHGEFVPIVCRLVESETGTTVNILLGKIRSISGHDSTVYDPDSIRNLATRNELPLRTVLSVTNQSGRQQLTRIEARTQGTFCPRFVKGSQKPAMNGLLKKSTGVVSAGPSNSVWRICETQPPLSTMSLSIRFQPRLDGMRTWHNQAIGFAQAEGSPGPSVRTRVDGGVGIGRLAFLKRQNGGVLNYAGINTYGPSNGLVMLPVFMARHHSR